MLGKQQVKKWINNLQKPDLGYSTSGSFNYHVDVKVKGTSPYQTCTISVNCFSRNDCKDAIGFVCKWMRVKEDRTYSLIGIHGNTYQISAQDIGSTIKVEITPHEEGFNGKALVSLGPVKLDPSTRSTLEGIMNAGGTRFPLHCISNDNKVIYKESASLLLCSDYMRIVANDFNGEEKSVKFKYSLEMPLVELNYVDTTKLALIFQGQEEEYKSIKVFMKNEKSDKFIKIGLTLVTRLSRDVVILAMRCFAAKNYLINSKVISNAEQLFGDEKKLFNESNVMTNDSHKMLVCDYLLEIESIKKELYSSIERNKEVTAEKDSLVSEIRRLEEELTSTIETYTKILQRSSSGGEGMTDSTGWELSALETKREDLELRKKFKVLEAEKRDLTMKVASLNEELEMLRHFNKNEGFFGDDNKMNSSLSFGDDLFNPSEIFNNRKGPSHHDSKARGFSGKASLAELDERNQALTQTIEALKSEIYSLKSKNESLERQLEQSRASLNNSSMINYSGNFGGNAESSFDYQMQKKRCGDLETALRDSLQMKIDNEKEIAKLKGKIDMSLNEIEQLRKENSHLRSQAGSAASLEEKVSSLEARLNGVSNQNDLLRIENNSLREKVEALKKIEYNPPPKENPNVSNKESELEIKLVQLSHEKQSLLMEVQNLKSKVSFLQQEKELEAKRKQDSPPRGLALMSPLEEKLQAEAAELASRYEKSQRECYILAENVEKLRTEKDQLIKELAESNKRPLTAGQNLNTYSIENKENLIFSDSKKEHHAYADSASSQSVELEKLRNENESLVAQRNQLSKKMESLQRELENLSKTKNIDSSSSSIIDRLQQTNSKLIEENGRLMEQLREREIERMSDSQGQSSGNKQLRDKIKRLEEEKELMRSEKDKLLVEFSRMSVSQRKKIFD